MGAICLNFKVLTGKYQHIILVALEVIITICIVASENKFAIMMTFEFRWKWDLPFCW